MMPKEPMRGATLFSHANKMTQAYHIMLTPLCKETGLPPLALDILLFLANNPEHNTAKAHPRPCPAVSVTEYEKSAAEARWS